MDTSTTALFEAMQRDLGLTREQAVRRFDDEAAASRLAAELQPRLGAEFAGAWFDEATGRLAVAATSTAAADQARDAGAIVKVVRYSLSDLESAKTELDDVQRAEPTRMADAILPTPSGPTRATPNASVEGRQGLIELGVPADQIGRPGARRKESHHVPTTKSGTPSHGADGGRVTASMTGQRAG